MMEQSVHKSIDTLRGYVVRKVPTVDQRTISAAVSPAALARFTSILVQDRAAGPSRNSAVARALRPSGLYTWRSLSLSMLRGMPVRPEGRIDREWAQSQLASRTPAVRRPAPDG